jgi:hypothetical protein
MKAFYLTIAVAAFAVYADAGVAILEKHPIDWYDCSGKADGNYVHPWECTRFISCSGGIASERDCANCDIDPVRCPDGRTVYDPKVDACLWADETTCNASQTPPTDIPTTTTVGSNSTEAPTTPSNNSTSTDNSITTTQRPGLPIVNTTCDPLDCETAGYCQNYMMCDEDQTPPIWVEKPCGTDLVWNPNGSPHGGNCDLWSNLDAVTNQTYRLDPNCLRCFWEEIGDCERDYWYQAPDLLTRTVERVSCGAGLVFSFKEKTCLRCAEKDLGSGNTCEAQCKANGNI